MPETLGSIIDRLCTCDLRMWVAQEEYYKIRKMDFDQFMVEYYNTSGMKKLYDALHKSCDLNLQRNVLIDDIDRTLLSILKSEDKESYYQPKHKTY